MTRYDLEHIARAAQQAGYTPAEVEQILFHELVPVFGSNLLSMAGEWAPWPQSFVEDRMREWFGRSCHSNWPTGVLVRPMLREDWTRLQPHLASVAPQPQR